MRLPVIYTYIVSFLIYLFFHTRSFKQPDTLLLLFEFRFNFFYQIPFKSCNCNYEGRWFVFAECWIRFRVIPVTSSSRSKSEIDRLLLILHSDLICSSQASQEIMSKFNTSVSAIHQVDKSKTCFISFLCVPLHSTAPDKTGDTKCIILLL